MVPPSSEQEPHGLGTQTGGKSGHVLVMLRSQGPEVYDEAGSGRLSGMLWLIENLTYDALNQYSLLFFSHDQNSGGR